MQTLTFSSTLVGPECFKKEPNSGTTTKPLCSPKLFRSVPPELHTSFLLSLPPSFLSLSLLLQHFLHCCLCSSRADQGTTTTLPAPLPSLSRQPLCGGGLSQVCVCSQSNRSWGRRKKKQAEVGGRKKNTEGTSCWYFFRREVKAGGGGG